MPPILNTIIQRQNRCISRDALFFNEHVTSRLTDPGHAYTPSFKIYPYRQCLYINIPQIFSSSSLYRRYTANVRYQESGLPVEPDTCCNVCYRRNNRRDAIVLDRHAGRNSYANASFPRVVHRPIPVMSAIFHCLISQRPLVAQVPILRYLWSSLLNSSPH